MSGLPATPREDLVFREVGGEWVIYDPAGRELHVLNVTAALVWQCLDGSTSRDEIVERLRDLLEGAPTPDEVAGEVDRVVSDFQDRGLLA